MAALQLNAAPVARRAGIASFGRGRESSEARAARIAEVARRLKLRYRDFAHGNKKNPLTELLYILCTIQSQEKTYVRTYRSLRGAFPTFASLHEARRSKVAYSIRKGGLSRPRARAIKLILGSLVARFGSPTLAPLREFSDEGCEEFLLALPSVGKKVARCVMLYALGREVFPVDTHCWRISQRLGLIGGRIGEYASDSEMDQLEARIPPRLRFSLHVNMVSFGRDVCRALSPQCGTCPLRDLCPSVRS